MYPPPPHHPHHLHRLHHLHHLVWNVWSWLLKSMKSSFNLLFKISDEDISININRCTHLDGDLLLYLKWKKKMNYYLTCLRCGGQAVTTFLGNIDNIHKFHTGKLSNFISQYFPGRSEEIKETSMINVRQWWWGLRENL